MRKHWPIVLAFALPLLLILVVLFSVYIPSLFISTEYDFIYATCEDNHYYYDCGAYLNKRYTVKDGKLFENTVTADEVNARVPIPENAKTATPVEYKTRIFLHDTAENQSREITLEEARGLNLSPLKTSPDGVTVTSSWDYNNDFLFPFSGRSEYYYSLSKGRSKSRLNIIMDEASRYSQNLQFIGWVL
ncbi:MAG: hypothetical protein Q8P52_00145 [bacterium]|nr:hypothetical protein [bacterium]